MKKLSLLLVLLLTASSSLLFAAQEHSNADKPSTPTAPTAPDAAWLAQAKADYSLKTCVVSGDEFGGSMGKAVDYVYQQAGKPDRLVRFCCKDCRTDFDSDPAKYLKLLDEAAAKVKKN